MTAQELRIGNWLYKNLADFMGNHYHQLIGWDIWQASTHPAELNIEFSPIPLTPEILEKAGFEKGKHIYIKGADLLALKDGYYYGFTDNEYGFDLENSTKIIYLHQLQNLYFALTGEELNIEL